MSTGKHYFIEQTEDGRYAIRAKDSDRASEVVETQEAAINRVRELNPEDHPNIERVRNTQSGGRDQWRSGS
jgi:hypothetical protein